jgi:uncharacterized DUF497 family protein
MEFEWDPQKAAKNLRKHKVTFNEAATVFDDPLSVTVTDPDHSAEEDRFIIVGRQANMRIKPTRFARSLRSLARGRLMRGPLAA